MEDYYCKNGSCENIAVYGYNSGENIFCKECSLTDMILSFLGIAPIFLKAKYVSIGTSAIDMILANTLLFRYCILKK